MTKEEDGKRIEYLKSKVAVMPEKPGSYQFYDDKKTIIYVGKAKNLKSRVSSYFLKEVDRYKTKVLVSKIHDLTYTVVDTEEDALLLENSLIKQYKPKYNILLKDGKTYPSICITNEPFPRIFKTRTINKKWGTYYGPYSHVGSMYAILSLIENIYKPRKCRQIITEEGIREKKYKPCLEYHLKNCYGCCIGKQSKEEYNENIKQAREILKGKTREITEMLTTKMLEKAEKLEFEEAEIIKQRLIQIENFSSKSEVVSHTIDNVDVVTITDDEKIAFINYIHVMNGQINQSFTFEYKKVNGSDETQEDILARAIVEMRQRFNSDAKEIIIEKEAEIPLEGVTVTVPQRGDKKHLIELSLLNGKQYKVDRLKRSEKLNPEQKGVRMMKEIQDHLHLPKLPIQIELFDNSNISGTDAVAACVVFRKLKPSKKDYRKYNIKTVTGPDDYASMQEVVRRRYSRIIEEGTPLPDLIITDGGKGQMSVVREVVEDELHLNIPIAGLAKDNHHRTNELLYGFPTVSIGLKTDSELFRTLTRMQDEVHRFAITFHRDKRSKRALHSALDDIKGLGEKGKAALIKELKTVKHIQSADLEQLTSILGKAKGKIVYDFFHKI